MAAVARAPSGVRDIAAFLQAEGMALAMFLPGPSAHIASAYHWEYPASLLIRFIASLGSSVSTSLCPFPCTTPTLTVFVRSKPCTLIICPSEPIIVNRRKGAVPDDVLPS